MTRHKDVVTLLALTLTAALVLAGCPDPKNNSKNSEPPGPGDLPQLPVGITAVASDTEAIALLNVFNTSDIGGTIDSEARAVVKAALAVESKTPKDDYSLNNIPGDGVMVVQAEYAESWTGPWLGDDYDTITYTVGQSGGNSTEEKQKLKLTENKTRSTITALSGSFWDFSCKDYQNYTVTTTGTWETTKVDVSRSTEYVYAFGFTVQDTTTLKAAKIILHAKCTYILSASDKTMADLESLETTERTYSGSLRVYGADDAVVYELPITDRESNDETGTYFSFWD
ncbi:hypothetical protein AGMMS49942_01750 [Spirochaetia bacterium]|nr:hypothetical protein AGMMS49942_01750 [Spirochaetia bacterium]